MNENDSRWDSIVVGGGAAGLSAALVLGRARLRTLVVDAGQQSNLPATGVGGLLGHDGRPPADLYAAGRAELERYPSVEVRTATAIDGEPTDGGFRLVLTDGSAPVAGRVVLATGTDYRPRDVLGVAERWGGSVFHCPFCHGWEVGGEEVGLPADALAVEALQLSSVPGVFVAGDATGAMPSVVNAIASGSNAAAMVVRDLAGERFGVHL